MFEAEEWSGEKAGLEIWSDTGKGRLGFWAPKLLSAFFGDPIIHDASSDIFFDEAIAIITAIQWSSSLSPIPAQLAIHTDSNSPIFSILSKPQILTMPFSCLLCQYGSIMTLISVFSLFKVNEMLLWMTYYTGDRAGHK